MPNFETAYTSKLSMKVNKNADGNIATESEITAGVKECSIDGFKKDGTLTEADTLFGTFYHTICNATYDSLSAKKTTVQGVET